MVKLDHFYNEVYGWFTWPRLYRDMVMKFPSGSSFVEVGTFKGQSLSYLIVEMINSGKEFSITVVDSFIQVGGSVEVLNKNLKSVKDKYKVMIGNSEDVAHNFKDDSLDFVFIDADHEYENVKKDILSWMPKVKKGGILAGHDYPYYLGVKKAVDEILGDKIDQEYIEDELCWLIQL